MRSPLRQVLLDEFNIEAEDDSPAQIARLLCVMHAEVGPRAQARPPGCCSRPSSLPQAR